MSELMSGDAETSKVTSVRKRRHDVIVVGAGISGLAAAKWLHEAGVDVVVLEARDRVGGRTYTKKDVPGVDYVEMGGAYLGIGQKHVLRLARDLGVEKYVIDEVAGSTVYYDATSGHRQLFPADREPQIWNPIVLLDFNNLFRTIEELGKEIPLAEPWKAPHAEEWDRMTVKEFADKVIWTQTMKEMFRTFHNVRMASHAYEASLLWFLWDIKQYRGVKRLLSPFGAEKWQLVGGAVRLSEKIVERLTDARVKLNSPVVGVQQSDVESDASCTVTTLDGSTYEADYVILALPPVLTQKIHFQPALPAIRQQLIQRVPVGSVVKVIVFYAEAYWHQRGLSGSLVIESGADQHIDDRHPLNFTMDGTRPDGSHPSLIGFIWTDKASRLLEHTDLRERKRRIARSLAKAFGDERLLEPILYEEFNWSADQYSGGCYNMVLPPGCFTTYGRALRAPIGRLFFAATETAVDWIGHMDGAVSAGERAAREALNAMGKISRQKIWPKEPDNPEDGVIEEDVSFTRVEMMLPSVGGLVNFLKGFAAIGVLVLTAIVARHF